jgi:hypothetical protein
VRVVSEQVPTPQEALDALAEASSQAALVRRAGRQFGYVLLGIAAIYLSAGALISTLPDPRRAGPFVGLALLVLLTGGLIGAIWILYRIRAYSRTSLAWYFAGIAAFNLWNGLVVGVSIGTRWWAATQPAYHFGLSAIVAVIPLLVAAWLIGRR